VDQTQFHIQLLLEEAEAEVTQQVTVAEAELVVLEREEILHLLIQQVLW
jgi:hypothetical protein